MNHQNVIKVRDRGVTIDLILTDEAFIDVNGVTVWGRRHAASNVTQKWELQKRPIHEKTGKGTKTYEEAEKYVAEFEAKFDKSFLDKHWSTAIGHMRFMNVVYKADYYKLLPSDKPLEAIVESTKRFLVSGVCEQNDGNVSAIRSMFSAYMNNCDRFYQQNNNTNIQKTVVKKQDKQTSDEKWLNRAQELHKDK